MLNKIIIAVAATTVLVSGCASIVSKSQYPVAVTSAPDGARFTITDEKGVTVHSGVTPATVTLKSSDGYFSKANYTIKYEKAGYTPETSTMNPELNGWYWGNILVGGVIGMLIIDPITGAMYKLPETHNVSLNGSKKVSSNDQPLKVVSIADITAEQRAQLIRIN